MSAILNSNLLVERQVQVKMKFERGDGDGWHYSVDGCIDEAEVTLAGNEEGYGKP